MGKPFIQQEFEHDDERKGCVDVRDLNSLVRLKGQYIKILLIPQTH